MNVNALYWWFANIGTGNFLVPSGNTPLSEPMLSQIYVAACRHYGTELIAQLTLCCAFLVVPILVGLLFRHRSILHSHGMVYSLEATQSSNNKSAKSA